jgi:hypothetical protein
MCLKQPQKSAVEEKWIDTTHHIGINSSSILRMAATYMVLSHEGSYQDAAL